MPLPYNIAQYIYQQAPTYGVDPNLALGIANAESGGANGALNGNPDSGGMSFGPFQLFFSSGNPLGNNSPSVGTGFVNTYGVAPNASNWQQQVDYSLQTMSQPGGLSNWSTYNNLGATNLTASGQNIANSLGLSSSGSAASSNDPLGSSVTIAGEYDTASGLPYDEGTAYTGDTSNLIGDLGGSTGATSTALGNNQGTPNLGGGITNTSGQAIPANSTQNLGAGAGQPVNITDLPGLDTTIKGAGSSIQSGAQNAATGIAGTIASAVNSLEQYTSSAFVVAALVVVGVIMLAYGLGIFKKVDIPVPIPI